MKHSKNKCGSIKLNPIAASLLLLMPVVAQAADLKMVDGNVTTSANGVPVINIKAPNSKGISHNVYESLNVGKEGLIFNNSGAASTTQATSGKKSIFEAAGLAPATTPTSTTVSGKVNSVLAGQIDSNPNLAGGSTARVILNEVTSKNASTLNGMMEVAGDSAHLIIANPNGITTQGSGFINASKATLTTGTPNMEDGDLVGYTVNKGTITVAGLKSASPTEILARSVKVTGNIEVDELAVVSGNNTLDKQGAVTGQATATGRASGFGVDVSNLGGMYANKISLISTESGTGVRNAGTIAGGTSGIQVISNGRLVNSNATIKSSGNIAMRSYGSVDNAAGKIAGENMIYIDSTGQALNNTRAGSISAVSNVYLNTGAIDNTNGKLASGNTLAVNTNKQKLTNSGKGKNAGIEAAVVALETGALNNENGQIHAYHVAAKTSSINNNAGVIDVYNDVRLESTGNIDNERGLVRSSVGAVNVTTTKAVRNNYTKTADTTSSDSLGLIAGNGVNVTADYVYNWSGQIASTKGVKLETTSDIDNYQGRITSKDTVALKGRTLQSSQSGIVGDLGVNIEMSQAVNNRVGMINSSQGDVVIKGKSVNNSSSVIAAKNITVEAAEDLDTKYSLLVASKQLNLKAGGTIDSSSANQFGDLAGQYFGIGNQEGGLIGGEGVTINAWKLKNDLGRIVAQTGDVKITTGDAMVSNNALVAANAGSMLINSKRLYADYSTLYSSGDLRIDTTALSLMGSGSVANNNLKGVISSDNNVLLNINGDFSNSGWINGKTGVTLASTGYLTNLNTINSDKDVTITGKTLTNNGDISAKKALTITTNYDVVNNGNGNISGYTTLINADSISNRGNLVADNLLDLTAKVGVYNYKNMFTQGNAVIKAQRITNNGFKAVLGGVKGLDITPKTVGGYFGTVVGL